MPRTGRASRRPRPKGLPDLRSVPILPFMLNGVSILIGLVALVLAVLAFFPLLGWANWFIIPLAVVGAGLGAISSKTSGRNLNLVVIGIGVIRLMLGGGII